MDAQVGHFLPASVSIFPFLENCVLAAVIYVLITSRLAYCNAFYMELLFKIIQKLQLVHNIAASYLWLLERDPSSSVLKQYLCLPACFLALFRMLVLTFKPDLNDLRLGYLKHYWFPCEPASLLRSGTFRSEVGGSLRLGKILVSFHLWSSWPVSDAWHQPWLLFGLE